MSAESIHLTIAAGRRDAGCRDVPLGLVLGEDLALGVVADDLDVDKAAEVELLGAEHGHDGGGGMNGEGEVSWSSSSSSSSLRCCPINFGDQRAKRQSLAKLFYWTMCRGLCDSLRFPTNTRLGDTVALKMRSGYELDKLACARVTLYPLGNYPFLLIYMRANPQILPAEACGWGPRVPVTNPIRVKRGRQPVESQRGNSTV